MGVSHNYNKTMQMVFEKKDNCNYSVYSINNQNSPKTIINGYDNDSFHGNFYIYDDYGWMDGFIDGKVYKDSISGVFHGFERIVFYADTTKCFIENAHFVMYKQL